jgi:RNA polymerase sigma factor (sigma-70 family)
LSDAQLLERFVAARDEAAFGALVHRHGPMVLGVCQRVLRDVNAAEDTLQAVFIVLARRAASLGRKPIGGWLYAVTHKIAVKARAHEVARRNLERRGLTVERAEPIDELVGQELRSVLDDEIASLPEKLRLPIVLCYFQGKSHQEAAQELGWPKRSLTSRLERGRDLLRKQLVQRGITLSAGALAAILCEQATGTVLGAILTIKTAKAALSVTAGKAALGGGVSAAALRLAEEAMTGLPAIKGVLVAMVVACGLTAGGLGVAGLVAPAETSQATLTAKTKAPTTEVDQSSAIQKAALVATDLFGDPLPAGAIARLGTVRWRHDDFVYLVAMPPNGKTVVSAGYDRFVRVWDFATGKELRRFGPGRTVEPIPANEPEIVEFARVPPSDLVAVSGDGKTLATRFAPKAVDLWEVGTGNKRGSLSLQHEYDEGGLALAPDGRTLTIASIFGQIRLWDLEAAKIVREFGRPTSSTSFGGLWDIFFSPDGKTLACVMVRNNEKISFHTIEFWDPATGALLRTVKTEEARTLVGGENAKRLHCVAYSPDSQLFAYATRDSEVCVLRVANGEFMQKWKTADELGYTLMAFAADSAKLYTKSSHPRGVQFQEWDVKTGRRLRNYPVQDEFTGADNRYAMATGRLVLTPDGKTLVTGSGSNSVQFFDLQSGRALPMPAGHRLSSLRFMPDGKSLLTSAFDCSFRWWDTSTGKEIKHLSLLSKAGRAVTRDGRYVAIVEFKTNALTLVDNSTGKEIMIKSGPAKGSQRTFFFSPDGGTLLVHDSNAFEVLLYDIARDKEHRLALPQRGFVAFLFSHNGQRLAVFNRSVINRSGPHDLKVCDTLTGKTVVRIEADEAQALGSASGGAFSPDGRTLAFERSDGRVELFELATGKVRFRYGEAATTRASLMESGPPNRFVFGSFWDGDTASSTVAFSPDGRLLAHARGDKVLEIWDVATGQTLARFAGHTGPLSGVAFSTDGRSVATSSHDSTVLVWDISALSTKGKRAP